MGDTDDVVPGPQPWGAGGGEPRVFSVAEAHALLPQVRKRVDELVTVRADLAELAADLRAVGESALGGMAELKAKEARLSEIRAWFGENGIEVKNLAPVLIDFPAVLSGVSVRLCWLEGESGLGWYHRSDLGFIGRRPLPPTERER
ncbi:hypothetical protein HDA32_001578 [Spinactinospora alkalitolerans]|uniref:DUF2203 family protein n=1 Tax=Spinactinospora alkalitolerans TaxID=687207 RepID=A0A852TR69_9ACTN|nr:DUF2203 domain-containing protein [Spinactinospora alkalitolerans]NYE46458.1 hypothetical protein [Spinactinospora alkalitolerans]